MTREPKEVASASFVPKRSSTAEVAVKPSKLGKLGLPSRRALWALASSWLLLATVGTAIVARAEARPDGASHVAHFPRSSGLKLSTTRPTLLVFVHPQCPCSVSTVAELERLLAHSVDRLDVQVVVFLPTEETAGWRSTSLVRSAQAIPGVRVVFDPGGREGALFGATTSGQVLLFEPGGDVVFRGGITGARGHEGDNDGRAAIEAIASGRTPLLRDTNVFGCAFGTANSVKP